MDFIKLMELAHDEGFQRRVQMAMFIVARNKSGSVDAEDVAFVAAIVKGAASVFQMALGVLTDVAVIAAGDAVTDTELEAAITTIWSVYAKAGV